MASTESAIVRTKAGEQDSFATIEPYLQRALSAYNAVYRTVYLFNPHLSPEIELGFNFSRPTSTWPSLTHEGRNQILLFPGSFNPPHQGHLATIRYFFERRDHLGIVAMFIFADPDDVIRSKDKNWGNVVLPQGLRNNMFAQVPYISNLIVEGWLHLLVGDMEGHIAVLRSMTDLIAGAGFDVRLVGFLGGDKLSVSSPPHLPPGELAAWGPVDEFLIINARRPVDFYNPEADTTPRDLPGCSEWKRDLESDLSDMGEEMIEGVVGTAWICRALTVPGEPYLRFRASKISASNGISSTNIRKIMSEVPGDELLELLGDQVLSVGLLVAWLQNV